MTRLNEVLQGQNEAIRDINTRVTSLSQEVESLQSMNYDKIYSYIDRQVGQLLGLCLMICSSLRLRVISQIS